MLYKKNAIHFAIHKVAQYLKTKNKNYDNI